MPEEVRIKGEGRKKKKKKRKEKKKAMVGDAIGAADVLRVSRGDFETGLREEGSTDTGGAGEIRVRTPSQGKTLVRQKSFEAREE